MLIAEVAETIQYDDALVDSAACLRPDGIAIGCERIAVSSSCREGRIDYVVIESQTGGECRLRNPFDGAAVLYRNGHKDEVMNERLLRFRTARNEKITVVASV